MFLCNKNKKPIYRKLVVVGDGSIGKSSILNVFTKGFFPQVYEPTVFENYVHEMTVDGQTLELSLFDTAGQEEFDRLRSLSYADTHVVMMCYAVDSLDSLENIPNRWMEEVSEYCPYAKLILVALKCDLRDDEQAMKKMNGRPVLYEEGLNVARSINAVRYLECSAKHNRGIREVFEQAGRVALSVHLKTNNDTSSSSCIIL
ncbi:GTP-binding protein Rho3 [Halteromyces radiatus]|uniref:GTP-binding protein Rho3 n=1 Tax=Halteromyces radiatus TaxID=101107 RepID=UPI0022201A3C|nr:GTP-binding protein Rho3 [Halteromyces radiatus]KAI8099666.1 GTP-binding protein Rho3 [Halteromyces radiatus]